LIATSSNSARAVSQKDLEQSLAAPEGEFNPNELKKVKARIEIVGDSEDLKRIKDLVGFTEEELNLNRVVLGVRTED
jgi:hypothetical protein